MSKKNFSAKQPVAYNFIKYIVSKASILRLGGSLLFSVLITLFLIRVSHFNYWNKTIFRTQTVDFNILANILPTKLSALLVNKNIKELQRTIDSNYGLFGIVVTDCKTEQSQCPNQEILHISSGEVIKSKSTGKVEYKSTNRYAQNWQSELSLESLSGEFYEILRNPPPLMAEQSFKDARAMKFTSSGRTNLGDIVGRVYFLRNPPPKFFPSLVKWIKNPGSSSSAILLYNAISLATLITSIFVWLLLESKHYKASLAEQRQNEIEKMANIARAEKAEAENEALRYKAYWKVFAESFDQDFAAIIANQLEEIRGFFRRLDIDIDNIVHDICKAPLLTIGSQPGDLAHEMLTKFTAINEEEKQKVANKMIEFLVDTNNTIHSIQWVLNDLRQVANINAEVLNVNQIIEEFLNNKPPYVKFNSIQINFNSSNTEALWISCNTWHLKSVVKNVLYNCAAALENYQVDLMMTGRDKNFVGIVDITCFKEQERACIQIADNGSGYPESIIDILYQQSKIASNNPGGGRGGLIVYSYLKLHSGTAKIKNNVDTGGQVTFSFPLVSPPELSA